MPYEITNQQIELPGFILFFSMFQPTSVRFFFLNLILKMEQVLSSSRAHQLGFNGPSVS